VAKKNEAPTTLGQFIPLRYSFHSGLSRPDQLRNLLSRLEELRRDPKFLDACHEYFKEANGDPVQFFEQWGVWPIYSDILSRESFQKCAEFVAEKHGATKTIVVYPWTSTKDLIRSLRADGFLKSKIRFDFEDLRWKTMVLMLKKWGFSARDIAEAVGDNIGKKSRKKYSNKLSQLELDKADAIFKTLLSGGLDYNTADSKALRTVKKARYKEPSVIPNYRMAYNRALKDLLKISRLIKSHSRPRS
jgi:hypothetical protein